MAVDGGCQEKGCEGPGAADSVAQVGEDDTPVEMAGQLK